MAKTCKDCAHYELCADYKNNICETCNWRHEEFCMNNGTCGFFKDKSLFIELPCKVGDTVYMPWNYNDKKGIAILEVTHIIIDGLHSYIKTDFYTDDEGFWNAYNGGNFNFSDIAKTVFLTFEAAEKALKERKV